MAYRGSRDYQTLKQLAERLKNHKFVDDNTYQLTMTTEGDFSTKEARSHGVSSDCCHAEAAAGKHAYRVYPRGDGEMLCSERWETVWSWLNKQRPQLSEMSPPWVCMSPPLLTWAKRGQPHRPAAPRVWQGRGNHVQLKYVLWSLTCS